MLSAFGLFWTGEVKTTSSPSKSTALNAVKPATSLLILVEAVVRESKQRCEP